MLAPRTLLVGFLLSLAVPFAACDGGGGDNDDDVTPPPSDEVTYGETVVARTARVVAPGDSAEVLAVSSSGEVVLRASAFGSDSLAAGEVLIAGPSAAAPNGVLRRVLSIRREGDVLRAETGPATLSDVIVEGRAQGSFTFGPSDVRETLHLAPGVTLSGRTERVSLRPAFEYNVNDVLLYDADNDSGTTDDQVRASGRLALEPGIDIDWEWSRGRFLVKPERVYFNSRLSAESDLTVSTAAELASIEAQLVIAEYVLSAIIVPVGASPVIVVLTPVVRFVLKADGSVEGVVEASVGYTMTTNRSVEWFADAPTQWGGGVDYADASTDVDVALETQLGLSVRSPLDILVYGVVGPSAFLEGRASLTVAPFETPWWSAELAGQVGAGLRLTVFGRELSGVDTEVVAGLAFPLGDAGGPIDIPLPPRIFDPQSRLVGGSGCEPEFGRWEMSMAYRDPNGDVTEGSFIVDDWAFEAGNSGTLTAEPLLSGSGFEGRASFPLCTRFGSSPSITDLVRLVDASGSESEALRFYRERPLSGISGGGEPAQAHP